MHLPRSDQRVTPIKRLVAITLVVLVSFFATTASSAGDLEDGLAALTAKDYPTALRLLTLSAQAGNSVAQSNLGYMYRDGTGVRKDYAEAQKWLRLSADQGNGFAQNGMGVLYRNGFGVAQNYGEAVKWFKLSAAQNNRSAQSNLGEMVRDGHGITQDYAEAQRLLRLSAAQNNPFAQSSLAFMHRNGLGMPKDYAEALRLYRLSAAQGNPHGQNGLGIMYREGFGVEKSYDEALKWFKAGAARQDPGSQANLGNMFELGRAVTQDFKEATRLYLLAAAQGNTYAKQRLETDAIKTAAAQPEPTVLPPPLPVPSLAIATTAPARADAKVQAAPTGPVAQRRALVIGNDSYLHVAKLQNAREDARAIAQNLTQVGYQVTLKLDLNEKDMKIALRNFKLQVEGGDEVMIFYAGHGVQIGAANFLLPTDIAGESEEQVKDDGIPLQKILDDMTDRKAKFTLAMIDACRDNPFKKSGRALGGRGLSPTTAATGQMVIFSAGTGQQALDRLGPADTNKNGLFTRVFLKEMQKPGVSVDRVMRAVRNDVVGLAKAVGHEQVPAIYDQVVGEFYFRP